MAAAHSGNGETYVSLQNAHLQLGQRFPRLVAVADVLECLGRVLAGHI